jgi:hypothetical protein
MEKKIVTTAKHLASLDLLIADKKAGEVNYLNPHYWIIIIIIEGIGIGGYHPGQIQDYPPIQVLDQYTNAAVKVFEGATVDQLLQLRKNIHEKK